MKRTDGRGEADIEAKKSTFTIIQLVLHRIEVQFYYLIVLFDKGPRTRTNLNPAVGIHDYGSRSNSAKFITRIRKKRQGVIFEIMLILKKKKKMGIGIMNQHVHIYIHRTSQTKPNQY